MTKAIEVSNMSCSYGKKTVLSDISFSVKENTVFFLIGNNGSGKTTLMNCVLNNKSIQSGEIKIFGESVSSLSVNNISRMISYVPQVIAVNCDFKVKDYLVLGRNPYISMGNPSIKDYDLVFSVADKMKLNSILENRFSELSGGQKQWCAISRALIQETPIIVMDEPMSALDMGKQAELLLLINKLRTDDNKTIILTTHNPNHCLKIKSEVCWLHDNSIFAIGVPDEVFTEDNITRIYGHHVILKHSEFIDFEI